MCFLCGDFKYLGQILTERFEVAFERSIGPKSITQAFVCHLYLNCFVTDQVIEEKVAIAPINRLVI